jgi:hypothetical protein
MHVVPYGVMMEESKIGRLLFKTGKRFQNSKRLHNISATWKQKNQ